MRCATCGHTYLDHSFVYPEDCLRRGCACDRYEIPPAAPRLERRYGPCAYCGRRCRGYSCAECLHIARLDRALIAYIRSDA